MEENVKNGRDISDAEKADPGDTSIIPGGVGGDRVMCNYPDGSDGRQPEAWVCCFSPEDYFKRKIRQ